MLEVDLEKFWQKTKCVGLQEASFFTLVEIFAVESPVLGEVSELTFWTMGLDSTFPVGPVEDVTGYSSSESEL